MSIRSMTGFARATGTLPDGTPFAWELRSVNGRGLDVRLRLPGGLDVLELPLREAAAGRRQERDETTQGSPPAEAAAVTRTAGRAANPP